MSQQWKTRGGGKASTSTRKEIKKEEKALKTVNKQLRKEEKLLKRKNRKSLRRNNLVWANAKPNNAFTRGDAAYREAKAYDAIDTQYLKCVFDPLNNLPTRIPSIFPSPTAVYKKTQIVDITVPITTPVTARSYIMICPWNLIDGTGTNVNIPSWISFSTNRPSVATTEFAVAMAHPMQGFMGDYSLNDGSVRFQSYRVVATQAQLECVAPVLNIQGSVASTCLMGPGPNNTAWVMAGTPDSSQIIQHPFGYERPISTITASNPMRTNYFPLDPMDQTFHTANEPEDWGRYRSPIIFVFDNITANVQFRLKVTTVIEYLPTLSFRQWTDTEFPDDKPRSIEIMRNIVSKNPIAAVSGELDNKISRTPPGVNSGDGFLSWLRRAGGAIADVGDELGGVSKLVGKAIRLALD